MRITSSTPERMPCTPANVISLGKGLNDSYHLVFGSVVHSRVEYHTGVVVSAEDAMELLNQLQERLAKKIAS